MNSHSLRRASAVGLAAAALVTTAGCSRHLGAQPDAGQGGPVTTTAATTGSTGTGTTVGRGPLTTPAGPQDAGAQAKTAAQATAALGTAIQRAGAAASTQSSDLSASAGSSEGDPTQ